MHRALLVLAASLAIGCTDGETDETLEEDESCAAYSWDTVGGPYTRTWCSGCHGSAVPEGSRAGAPVGVDFDTHQQVVDRLDRVIERATIGEPPAMPPGGGPSETALADFVTWVECGAP